MNMYEGKLIMYACIIRETFVFTVFHLILKLELCRHACRRRDQIIPTCRYGKNMPTTALIKISTFLKKIGEEAEVVQCPFKLDSYSNANVFSMRSDEVKRFHSDSTPLLSDKMLLQIFQTTNRILCHERGTLLKLNFFQHDGAAWLLRKRFDIDLLDRRS